MIWCLSSLRFVWYQVFCYLKLICWSPDMFYFSPDTVWFRGHFTQGLWRLKASYISPQILNRFIFLSSLWQFIFSTFHPPINWIQLTWLLGKGNFFSTKKLDCALREEWRCLPHKYVNSKLFRTYKCSIKQNTSYCVSHMLYLNLVRKLQIPPKFLYSLLVYFGYSHFQKHASGNSKWPFVCLCVFPVTDWWWR